MDQRPFRFGKTTLRESVQLLIGGMARYFKGLETTDAGLRQKLESDSCPVIFDEADSDNAAKTANMGRILALLRTATDGDVGITKGGADGKSVTYLMRNAFLLFSVRSMIEKASEQSRILNWNWKRKSLPKPRPFSNGITNWPPSSDPGTWGANTSPASFITPRTSAATLNS